VAHVIGRLIWVGLCALAGCTPLDRQGSTPSDAAEVPQLWTPAAITTDGYESSPTFTPDERCGADLIDVMSDAGMPIEPGALYPMLRRLEDQGLLVSEWRVEESRRKRFYSASSAGCEIAAELTADLARLIGGLHSLNEDKTDDNR